MPKANYLFEGVPSPVRYPQNTDMIVFRENSEDIYTGIEFEANSKEAKKIIDFLSNEMELKILDLKTIVVLE